MVANYGLPAALAFDPAAFPPVEAAFSSCVYLILWRQGLDSPSASGSRSLEGRPSGLALGLWPMVNA